MHSGHTTQHSCDGLRHKEEEKVRLYFFFLLEIAVSISRMDENCRQHSGVRDSSCIITHKSQYTCGAAAAHEEDEGALLVPFLQQSPFSISMMYENCQQRSGVCGRLYLHSRTLTQHTCVYTEGPREVPSYSLQEAVVPDETVDMFGSANRVCGCGRGGGCGSSCIPTHEAA
jgi:hypothetical protein